MKILLSSRGLFALAFLILVATNVVVLLGVVSNRSADPEALIKLTERELQLPHPVHEENTGLSLRLTWRALGKEEDGINHPGWRSPAWLGIQKLQDLGFHIDDNILSNGHSTHDKELIPKEVFVVLENNGAQYKEALHRAERALAQKKDALKSNQEDKQLHNILERAEKRLQRERTSESRLFAVDAGLKSSDLRKKYGDRTRFIITKGLVQPGYTHSQDKKEVLGYIRRLSVESIHVPRKHRKVLDAILLEGASKRNESDLPRYAVALAYGSRLEPWILSVRHTDDKSH